MIQTPNYTPTAAKRSLPCLALLVPLLALLLVGCQSVDPTATESPNLILATTTSTQDSGLLDLLIPQFQDESGYLVQTIAVGTGAALKMAEEGNADVLLVHAPPAEKELMDAGFGKERFLIMHNDFVLVGPPDDPAGISGGRNAAAAFGAVAAAEANFVSRGDDSGTNKKELNIWNDAGYLPNQDKPTWYLESGQGMGASLVIASQKKGYMLTDRATYLATQQNLDLEILVEGDSVLLNIYHVITVNPEKWPNVDHAGALSFANYLVSQEVQDIISTFGVDTFGQPLFFPDADKTEAELTTGE